MSAHSPLDAAESLAVEGSPTALAQAKAATPYQAVLRNPTCALASNAGERPDVASSAILGYN
ncbi:hypothetical protein [Burkholderia sp. A1]|uniref:hypothetical protein n=1 Tax=Burkholderia sp. A1 TaxID=148446 RepID=UPI000468DBE9|nr:hypothetical protein [Burkholderia sp. A1]